jgi:hypothetical protein
MEREWRGNGEGVEGERAIQLVDLLCYSIWSVSLLALPHYNHHTSTHTQHTHTPPSRRIKVGIVSRRRKRFILNEHELADEALRMGFEVVFLPFETMTYFEQIRELRSLDVMMGLHGRWFVFVLLFMLLKLVVCCSFRS